MLHTQNEHTVQQNNELTQELKLVHTSTQQGEHLPQPGANVITSLHEQIATLNVRLEVQCQLKECAMTKTNELIKELKDKRLDITL